MILLLYNEKPTALLPKLWSRDFILLLLSNLFVYQGVLMFIPTFPVYIKQIGGNDLQASLPFAVISVSALLLRSVSGYSADLIGRKPILFLGLSILLIFNCSFFLVSAIGLILVLRFLQGIGWGMTSTVLATLMSDIVPCHRRGEGTGYFALSIIIATSLATIMGIEVMNRYNFTLVLILSTSLVILGLCLSMGIKTAPTKGTLNTILLKNAISRDNLFEKQAVLPALLCFLHSIPLSGIMSFMMLYGLEMGIQNSWLYFVGHISMILLTRPFAGKIFDQKGHAAVIVPGILLMILGLTLLSLVHSSQGLLIASLFYGLGYGAAHPSLQAWAINRSPANRKGAANGTFLSSIDLGYALGAIVLGTIAAHTNYAIMYRLSILFLVIFAVIYGWHLRNFTENKYFSEVSSG